MDASFSNETSGRLILFYIYLDICDVGVEYSTIAVTQVCRKRRLKVGVEHILILFFCVGIACANLYN